MTQVRHERLAKACVIALREAEDEKLPAEIRAEALRKAGDCFGKMVGTIGVEEVLGEIFSTFCVGK